MEQALADILESLQKLYQIKSVNHDRVQEELAIRRTASKVAHEDDVAKIAQMDKEELKKFLDAASTDNDMSVENVMVASSVINMATHPSAKSSTRYVNAVETIDKARETAAAYEELKNGLMDENLKLEEELRLVSNLSSSIVDGKLVDTEVYIPFFKNLLYPDDLESTLVAVTAVVRKNAELFENDKVEEELPYHIYPEQAEKLAQIEEQIKGYSLKYEENPLEENTNVYVESILGLLDKEKVTLEEAQKLLESYPGAYENLLFKWLEVLLKRAKNSTALLSVLETIEKIEKIDTIYQDLLSKEESKEALEKSLERKKTLIYNAWVDSRVPTFAYQNVNSDSLELLDQLRQGKDTEDIENIELFDGDVGVITGKETFVLFRKFPRENTFVVTSDSLSQKNEIVTKELVSLIAKSYSELNNWILNSTSEYSSMIAITEQVEEYWKNTIKGDK